MTNGAGPGPKLFRQVAGHFAPGVTGLTTQAAAVGRGRSAGACR